MIVFNLTSHQQSQPGYTGGLYAIRPGSEQPRQLTSNPWDYEPSFAPSGRQLVFRRFDPENRAEEGLYSLDLRTGRMVRLVRGQGDQDAAFGRRGMIAFTRFTERSYDLFVRLRSGKLRRLTSTRLATEEDPVFTPNGRRIVFSRNYLRVHGLTGQADGGAKRRPEGIYSIRTDGTSLRLIRTIPGASDLDVSPDGRRVAFITSGAHLWEMPLSGGRKRLVSRGVSYFSYAPGDSKLVYTNHAGLWVRPANGHRGHRARVYRAELSGGEGQLVVGPAWQPLP